MSYEIITRFNMNHKKNYFTITAHPNNVIPAAHYTFKETMSEKNMRALFENLLFGNWQPTNSITQLNYALIMARKETQEKYNINCLSDYIWSNAIYINNERIYSPVDNFAFSAFIKYLYEEEKPGKYFVTDNYYCYSSKASKYKYYYTYYDAPKQNINKYSMGYKKAACFVYDHGENIKNLQIVEA